MPSIVLHSISVPGSPKATLIQALKDLLTQLAELPKRSAGRHAHIRVQDSFIDGTLGLNKVRALIYDNVISLTSAEACLFFKQIDAIASHVAIIHQSGQSFHFDMDFSDLLHHGWHLAEKIPDAATRDFALRVIRYQYEALSVLSLQASYLQMSYRNLSRAIPIDRAYSFLIRANPAVLSLHIKSTNFNIVARVINDAYLSTEDKAEILFEDFARNASFSKANWFKRLDPLDRETAEKLSKIIIHYTITARPNTLSPENVARILSHIPSEDPYYHTAREKMNVVDPQNCFGYNRLPKLKRNRKIISALQGFFAKKRTATQKAYIPLDTVHEHTAAHQRLTDRKPSSYGSGTTPGYPKTATTMRLPASNSAGPRTVKLKDLIYDDSITPA